jgi:2-phospho-L-lactate guanylyltransferase (CobY/MobA/RfbA family)
MREFIRPVAAALSIVCLAASVAVLSSGSALAQGMQKAAPAQAAPPAGQPPAVKQIALTDKQVEGVIAAAKDMDAVTAKMPQSGKPDPKLMAQLEATAKKYGFASYADYNGVVDNIGMVMSGIDSVSKKYVGNAAVIKAQIAEVQADKKMSAKDKKAALDDLNQAAKAPEPTIENKGNIDLVVKNYDKLAAIMGEDQN